MAMTRSPFSLQRASDNKEQSLMVCDEDRGREDNRAMDGGDRKWAGTVKKVWPVCGACLTRFVTVLKEVLD